MMNQQKIWILINGLLVQIHKLASTIFLTTFLDDLKCYWRIYDFFKSLDAIMNQQLIYILIHGL